MMENLCSNNSFPEFSILTPLHLQITSNCGTWAAGSAGIEVYGDMGGFALPSVHHTRQVQASLLSVFFRGEVGENHASNSGSFASHAWKLWKKDHAPSQCNCLDWNWIQMTRMLSFIKSFHVCLLIPVSIHEDSWVGVKNQVCSATHERHSCTEFNQKTQCLSQATLFGGWHQVLS